MIKRQITKRIKDLQKGFPVLAITGPRQSGKTTLIKNIFPKYEYFNLENPTLLALVENDPAGFLNQHNSHIILDEVQRIPILLSYIQSTVDEHKIMGDFIISCSENLLLSEKINQSLAGRVSYINLLPLSNLELSNAHKIKSSMYQQIFTGNFPAIYDRPVSPIDYYDSYLSTYVERDLKQISNITNLSLFRKFLALLAGRVGQLLNTSSLASDVGVTAMTIESWISILEASYIVFRLRPYHHNFGKRHIKSAKLYFTDTGLACRLLGIVASTTLHEHYLIGGLFENMVILEIKKYLQNTGNPSQLFFFRDSNGNEVDLIIDHGDKITPVEIKSSATFSPDFLKGISYWQNLTKKNNPGLIIYNGSDTLNSHAYSIDKWNSPKYLSALFSN